MIRLGGIEITEESLFALVVRLRRPVWTNRLTGSWTRWSWAASPSNL